MKLLPAAVADEVPDRLVREVVVGRGDGKGGCIRVRIVRAGVSHDGRAAAAAATRAEMGAERRERHALGGEAIRRIGDDGNVGIRNGACERGLVQV